MASSMACSKPGDSSGRPDLSPPDIGEIHRRPERELPERERHPDDA
jgi:hypothetical protein